MSEGTYRAYNDFDRRAIYTGNGVPHASEDWTGWQYEFSGSSTSTPITDDNLNAMLNMLIYIRNVIGKTNEFAPNINGQLLNSPDPDNLNDKSIAKYLETAFNAIIGTESDTLDKKTLSAFKKYLDHLAIKNGEGLSSLIQYNSDPNFDSDKQSDALSLSSIALGYNTTAGLRGFTIDSADDSAESYTVKNDINIDLSALENKPFSLRLDANYDMQGTITAVDGNKLFVDNYIKIEDSIAVKQIWFPFNPDIGDTDLGSGAVAEGYETQANMLAAHAEGYSTKALGKYSHTEGIGTKAYYAAHAEGNATEATGHHSHAEGNQTKSIGSHSHAEGNKTQAILEAAHAEGISTLANEQASHAEGYRTRASGKYSHAEGEGTENRYGASGKAAHSEGHNTTAEHDYSHAEGDTTIASGKASHAEGYKTTAQGTYSHAEGNNTRVTGNNSHVQGKDTVSEHAQADVGGDGTRSSANNQTVRGVCNVDNSKALFIVGNGVKANPNKGIEEKRSNAFTVLDDGRAQIMPTVELSDDYDVINKQYLDAQKYLTEQSLDDYATKNYIDNKIEDLVEDGTISINASAIDSETIKNLLGY